MSKNTNAKDTTVEDTVEYHVNDKVTHKDYEKEKAVFTIDKIDETSRRFRYLLVRGTPGKKDSHHIWASADDISYARVQPTVIPASQMASIQQQEEVESSDVTENQ